MHSIHINLIAQYKQNFLRIALGFAMLCFSGYTLFYPSQLETLLNSYIPVFIIAGIAYVIIGLGFNPISLFGKAYIKIDKEKIEVKPTIFKKSWTINWIDIKEVQIKVASIRFLMPKLIELDYGRMNEASVLELKTAIIGIAKEKNITLN